MNYSYTGKCMKVLLILGFLAVVSPVRATEGSRKTVCQWLGKLGFAVSEQVAASCADTEASLVVIKTPEGADPLYTNTSELELRAKQAREDADALKALADEAEERAKELEEKAKLLGDPTLLEQAKKAREEAEKLKQLAKDAAEKLKISEEELAKAKALDAEKLEEDTKAQYMNEAKFYEDKAANVQQELNEQLNKAKDYYEQAASLQEQAKDKYKEAEELEAAGDKEGAQKAKEEAKKLEEQAKSLEKDAKSAEEYASSLEKDVKECLAEASKYNDMADKVDGEALKQQAIDQAQANVQYYIDEQQKAAEQIAALEQHASYLEALASEQGDPSLLAEAAQARMEANELAAKAESAAKDVQGVMDDIAYLQKVDAEEYKAGQIASLQNQKKDYENEVGKIYDTYNEAAAKVESYETYIASLQQAYADAEAAGKTEDMEKISKELEGAYKDQQAANEWYNQVKGDWDNAQANLNVLADAISATQATDAAQLVADAYAAAQDKLKDAEANEKTLAEQAKAAEAEADQKTQEALASNAAYQLAASQYEQAQEYAQSMYAQYEEAEAYAQSFYSEDGTLIDPNEKSKPDEGEIKEAIEESIKKKEADPLPEGSEKKAQP